ncbi:MAG TPA: lysophospholipid acyltransferase family protein [Candidatus Thermoplasmatota archaeon]|nr:lysophospholipid acyltransferase family protein [Candidatus Thermoplasmatota archaeon]
MPRELDDVATTIDAQRERDAQLGEVDDSLIRRILVPYKLIRSYCRVTVEGLDRLPVGRAILAANHTGWLGLDYANLAVTIHDGIGRIVRGVVHEAWFANKKIGDVAKRLGLVPASIDSMVALLKQGRLVVIFPEGEHGAFKAVTEETKYKLFEFRRGFVRAAMAAKAPIVPVAIVGGEEANPSLATLKLTDRLFRLPLPVPQNVLPYPVKWRISFLDPIPMSKYRAKDITNKPLVHKIAADVQGLIQDELEVQLKKRGNKYL